MIPSLNVAARDQSRGNRAEDVEFVAMVWPHVRAMERLAVKKVGATEAEDAVQEALARAWKHRAALREAASVGGWLSSVTKRVCIDVWRRRRPTEALEEDLPASGPDISSRATDLDVHQLIRELPDGVRQVVVLRCYAEMTCGEIAATLRLTECTVRARLQHARRLLHPRLRSQSNQ